jgi:serine/threonine-protein kinase
MIFRIGDTRVPAVVGKTEVEALRMAEKAGLKVKVQKRSDPNTPENVVIETRPAPNSSVKKDSSLTIVVSSGAAQNRSQIPERGKGRESSLAHQDPLPKNRADRSQPFRFFWATRKTVC